MELSEFELRAKKETYLQKCCSKEVVTNTVFQCNVEKPQCEHYFYYGDTTFCAHPLRQVIGRRTQQAKMNVRVNSESD